MTTISRSAMEDDVTEEQLCKLGKKVEDLFSDPGRWVQRRMADNSSGKERYCLVGGIRQCAMGNPYKPLSRLAEAYTEEIEKTTGTQSAMAFNDSTDTTYEMVINAIKKTNARVCTTTKRAPWWRRLFRRGA